jgi:hypothetical protein
MIKNNSAALQAITDSLLNLLKLSPQSSFACRLTVPAESLSLEVNGVGKIRLPVTANRAKTLIKVARKAPFGRKDKTLTDPAVRDAWEIAKSRVRIDKRIWSKALNPALLQIGDRLGLSEGELKADLYKMLIYEPGQFFVPHRDSEKDDDMIATLVVVLPSEHHGGTLVIEHQDTVKRFQSNRLASDKLGLFAFYADCRHELRPVTDGYRIVLTYNLSYKKAARKSRPKAKTQLPLPVNNQLQQALGSYLSNTRHKQPLAVLLDHQYSQRSLRWSGLKNLDRSRALALEAALDAEYGGDGYHLNLALLTLHEIWDAVDEPFSHRDRYRYSEYDDWDDDDDEQDDDEQEDDEQEDDDDTVNHERLTLNELIEQYATLRNWRDRQNNQLPLDSLSMSDLPIAACIPIHQRKPASSYYEDYTGNAGNTLDRTYHRAAIVIWTQQSYSRVLAEFGLGHLLDYWRETLDGKPASDYVAALNSLDLPERLTPYDRAPETLSAIIDLLIKAENRELALNHLRPFTLHALTADLFPGIKKLGRLYGADFLKQLFSEWTNDSQRLWRWFEWVDKLESFTSYCVKDTSPVLEYVPAMLFDKFYQKCLLRVRERQRTGFLAEKVPLLDNSSSAELTAICGAAMALGDIGRIKRLEEFVLENAGLYETDGLVPVLQKIDVKLAKSFHRTLFALLEDRLQKEADSHVREKGDWRISHSISNPGALSAQLTTFLDDGEQRTLNIPMVKDDRKRMHRMIDSQELPVSHTTTRTGRPFTLNLAKKKSLFARERRLRAKKLDLLKEVRSTR